jgi:ATP-dependent phosphofructokinase / diphosphate-dependent phosphofructokinase
MNKILVLTGGGLAPGLNAFIHFLTISAAKRNIHVLGGYNGYHSILEPGNIIQLSAEKTKVYWNKGGTFLKTSRSNPLSFNDGIDKIRNIMTQNDIKGIIAVGGDDTNGAARKLAIENIPVIGVLKSVDNDLCQTFCTIGFPTAAERVTDFVSQLHDHAYSHSRVQVVEMPGGKTSGWIAACAGLADAHIIIPPEKEYNLTDVVNKVKEVHEKKGYAIVAVSHEARISGVNSDSEEKDTFGIVRKAGVAFDLKKSISRLTGLDTRMCSPAHWVQCGPPNDADIRIAEIMAKKAVQMVEDEDWGKAVCLSHDGLRLSAVSTDFSQVIGMFKGEKVRTLDDKYFDFNNMCIKEGFINYIKLINKDFNG